MSVDSKGVSIMKSPFKDNKAQTNTNSLVIGVVVLAVVAMVLGIMVMVFAEMEPSFLDSASSSIADETWNSSAPQGTAVTLTYTLAQTPNVVISNASGTFTETTDYVVYVGNSSLATVSGGGMANNLEYDVDYSYQDEGYITMNKVNTNVYKGFNLSSIAPIVLAAALVITIVLGMVAAMYVGRRD